MDITTNNLNRNNLHTTTPNTITIWQQNVNKSCTCQHDLISSTLLARKGIDIVALQELAINGFSNSIASKDWILVYPSMHNTDPFKTHSIFLIRSNILTEHWKQIDFPLGDVTVVQFKGRWGELTIFNIYNDCKKNDTIHQLETFTQAYINHQEHCGANTKPILWLGNFNWHHPH
jgi:hypothetical protein